MLGELNGSQLSPVPTSCCLLPAGQSHPASPGEAPASHQRGPRLPQLPGAEGLQGLSPPQAPRLQAGVPQVLPPALSPAGTRFWGGYGVLFSSALSWGQSCPDDTPVSTLQQPPLVPRSPRPFTPPRRPSPLFASNQVMQLRPTSVSPLRWLYKSVCPLVPMGPTANVAFCLVSCWDGPGASHPW